MIHGDINDLRRPDAVFIDEFGWRYLFGDEPFTTGRVLEMNDKRAVIVGMAVCQPTFQTFPILYCTYSQAVSFVPQERKTLTFILAKAKDDVPPETFVNGSKPRLASKQKPTTNSSGRRSTTT